MDFRLAAFVLWLLLSRRRLPDCTPLRRRDHVRRVRWIACWIPDDL